MKANVNDRISCMGEIVKISKIIRQDYWEGYGFDIEFLDARGKYRHWKQELDGGKLLRTVPTHFIVGESGGVYYDEEGNKVLLDYYGGDVTDLFKKYGML